MKDSIRGFYTTSFVASAGWPDILEFLMMEVVGYAPQPQKRKGGDVRSRSFRGLRPQLTNMTIIGGMFASNWATTALTLQP